VKVKNKKSDPEQSINLQMEPWIFKQDDLPEQIIPKGLFWREVGTSMTSLP